MTFRMDLSIFLVFFLRLVTPSQGQFCSYNEECKHKGYCDNGGFSNGSDPNHPQVYESRCVCSKSYTGPYCTVPVPNDESGDVYALHSSDEPSASSDGNDGDVPVLDDVVVSEDGGAMKIASSVGNDGDVLVMNNTGIIVGLSILALAIVIFVILFFVFIVLPQWRPIVGTEEVPSYQEAAKTNSDGKEEGSLELI